MGSLPAFLASSFFLLAQTGVLANQASACVRAIIPHRHAATRPVPSRVDQACPRLADVDRGGVGLLATSKSQWPGGSSGGSCFADTTCASGRWPPGHFSPLYGK